MIVMRCVFYCPHCGAGKSSTTRDVPIVDNAYELPRLRCVDHRAPLVLTDADECDVP